MPTRTPIRRRRFLQLAGAACAVGPTLLRSADARAAVDAGSTVAGGAVRVASVSTAVEGGVLPALADEFRRETGVAVTISRDDDPYDEAERGAADLVISHFGHKRTEAFVLKGLGRWPRTVFSNQLALFGPRADPARVRGLPSLVEAFRRIAHARAPYVLNETRGLRYLTDVVWCAAGRPSKAGWFVETGASKSDAMALAAQRGGYVLWGITPFLRDARATPRGLEPLVTADAMLQRLMVSVVVAPERVAGVNAAGAARFQDYLLSPATQARILEVHYPGIEHAVWAPAGRHNAGAVLPD